MSKEMTPKVLMENFEKEIQKVVPYLANLLPNEELLNRFLTFSRIALMRSQSLLYANPRSLLLALIWCAQRDMEPGVEDGAWLISYKVKGVPTVIPVPAYKWYIRRAYEIHQIQVIPRPIYEHDIFEVDYGLNETLIHKPMFGPAKGKLVGAHVKFVYPQGFTRFHVMDRNEIEKIRNSSASWKANPGHGIWKDWEEAMFLKTVIKQGFKSLALGRELRETIQEDSQIETGATVEGLMHESHIELPEQLPSDEPPKELDTSGFDSLVEGKLKSTKTAEEYQKTIVLLAQFCEITAAGNQMSVPQLKIMAIQKFESFWKAFEKFRDKATEPPAPKATEPSDEVSDDPGKHRTTPGLSFKDRQAKLWNLIVDKQIPLDIMKEVGVTEMDHITEENINDIMDMAQAYEPPKKGPGRPKKES